MEDKKGKKDFYILLVYVDGDTETYPHLFHTEESAIKYVLDGIERDYHNNDWDVAKMRDEQEEAKKALRENNFWKDIHENTYVLDTIQAEDDEPTGTMKAKPEWFDRENIHKFWDDWVTNAPCDENGIIEWITNYLNDCEKFPDDVWEEYWFTKNGHEYCIYVFFSIFHENDGEYGDVCLYADSYGEVDANCQGHSVLYRKLDKDGKLAIEEK